MDKKKVRIILQIIGAWLILGIGIIIGLNINIHRSKPKMPDNLAELSMGKGDVGAFVEDNYWRFVKQSYVLVGSYPNYEYYKIVKEVPRNDIIPENFYTEEGTMWKGYKDADGNDIGKKVIDISTYQKTVDWDKVAESGVDMVIIRVGFRGYGEEGKLVEDEMFKSHIEGALAAGIDVGVYFFSQALNYEEGVEEAKFAMKLIEKYEINGPVVIDTEDLYTEDARTYGLDVDKRTDGVVGFCETVERKGYTPMIYANRNWFVQDLDLTRLGDYNFWLAHYNDNFDFPYRIAGWQYTGTGKVEGIDGDVDMNIWFE